MYIFAVHKWYNKFANLFCSLVSDALKQQKDWTFSRLSLSLTLWYKQVKIKIEYALSLQLWVSTLNGHCKFFISLFLIFCFRQKLFILKTGRKKRGGVFSKLICLSFVLFESGKYEVLTHCNWISPSSEFLK